MNILFRCDGSVEIGMGHVVRCLALADHFKKNHNCNIRFAMRFSELGINKVLKSYPVIQSDENDFDYEDWLSNCISQSQSEILILDVRDGLAKDQLKNIKIITGIKVVTIDDPEDKRIESDIAFYPPIPQLNNLKWDGFNGKLFIGWEYVILRNEFLKMYPKPNNSIPNILVSMGGTDEKNMTTYIVKVLKKIKDKFEATFLVGSGFPHLEKLERSLKSVNFKFELYQNPNKIATVMSKTNFAIISFGITAYELSALRIPSIYFCLTRDHEESSRLFEMHGLGKTIGVFPGVNAKKVNHHVSQFLSNLEIINEMSEKASMIKISDLERITNSIIRKQVNA